MRHDRSWENMKEETSMQQSNEEPAPKLKYTLYTIQFLTGAIVMVLELVGTRVIGPFYGVSLYVWSSLISVTLLSLAVGYYIGGIFADRKAEVKWLNLIVFGAALFIILIPHISPSVLKMTNVLGVRLGALTSSFLLFSIPIFLLGMVTPFTVKLGTETIKKLGISAGRLYALSTIGSFLGTLSTGFVLIPNLGINRIIHFIGFTLLVVSWVWFIMNRRYLWAGLGGVIIVLLLLAVLSDRKHDRAGETKLVCQKDSAYGTIRVVDKAKARFMLVDASVQGEIDKDSYISRHDYIHYLQALAYYRPEGKSAFLIGLGVGSLPLALVNYGIITDVVEIDPAVVEAAKQYFRFKPPGAVYVEDGRYIVNNLQRKYDFVILDAYSGGIIPYQLCSVEMFRKIRETLGSRGVLAINCLDFIRGKKAVVSVSILKTLRQVFPYIHTYVSGESDGLENFIIFASGTPLKELKFAVDGDYPNRITKRYLLQMPALKKNYPGNAGVVLTDSHNPLESMEMYHSDWFRNSVISFFGEDLLANLE